MWSVHLPICLNSQCLLYHTRPLFAHACTCVNNNLHLCVCARAGARACARVCVLRCTERHIFPHCQHQSSELLLFKRRCQNSLLFFSTSRLGSALALFCSGLNWTLTGGQRARGCTLLAARLPRGLALCPGGFLRALNAFLRKLE